jgi:lipopolysaccharide biosynthesis glycosyltransferase
MDVDPLPYWIGFDAREVDAFDVCSFSAQRKSSIPLHVRALNHKQLRARGIFSREWGVNPKTGQMFDVLDGRPFSTEFAFTRFLVPALQNYQGWALFTDCDILWLDDIAGLYAERDDKFAVQVVKQNHIPQNDIKMDGQVQQQYPRKNWSSVILFNCSHPANKYLTPSYVNTIPGKELHTFAWLRDHEIGDLSPGWNFLVGHTKHTVKPRAMHFTDGGPWFEHLRDVPFGGWWTNEYDHMMKTKGRFE